MATAHLKGVPRQCLRAHMQWLIIPAMILMPTTAPAAEKSGVSPAMPQEQCALCGAGDLPRLLSKLRSPDPRERRLAARALSRGHSPLAIRPLEYAALRDEAPGVRKEALRALASIKDIATLGTLLGAILDPFESVRVTALNALGAFPMPKIRLKLAATLEDAALSLPMRRAALASLRRHQTQQAYAAIVAAADNAPADDTMIAEIRDAAVSPPPCETCTEPVQSRFIAGLFSPDASRRIWAINHIAQSPLTGADKAQLLDSMGADDDPAVRDAAVDRVIEATPHHSEMRVLLVKMAMMSTDSRTVERAGAAIVEDPRPETSDTLEPYCRDARPELARRAVKLLSNRTDPQATQILVDVIEHPAPEVARAALNTVMRRDIDPATRSQALRDALAHPSDKVTYDALTRLRSIDAATHAAVLMALARSERPDVVRVQALSLLGTVAGEQALSTLQHLATDDSKSVRNAALETIVTREEPEAVAALQDLLSSSDEPHSAATVRAAMRVGVPVEFALLERLMRSADSVLARDILQHLQVRKTQDNASQMVSVLAEAMLHVNTAVAEGALRVLVATPHAGPEATLEAIVGAIVATASPEVATRFYAYIVKWKPPGLATGQRKILATVSLNGRLRSHAAAAIGKRGAPDVELALNPYRQDTDPVVQRTVRRALDVALRVRGTTEHVAAEVAAADGRPASAGALDGSGPGPSTPASGDAAQGTHTAPSAAFFDAQAQIDEPDLPWDGRWPLVLGMAGLGSLAFGTVGDIAETESSGARVAVYSLGAVLGGATPFLLTIDKDVTAGQAFYINSHAAWSAAAALQTARLLKMEDYFEPGIDRGTAILAGLASAGLTTWWAGDADWSGSDAFFANLTAVQAGIATRAIGMLAVSGDDEPNTLRLDQLSVLGAWALGMMPATLFNRAVAIEKQDAGILALSMGMGAWMGAWAGLGADDGLITGNRQKLAVGAIAGQGLGYLTGVVLASGLDVAPGHAGRLALSGGLGSAAALGLAMLQRPSEHPDYGALGWLVNGGAAVALGGSLLMPQIPEFAPGKKGMLTLSTLYGAVAGAMLPLSDAQVDTAGSRGRRHVGGALLGGSLGLLAGAGIAPHVDPTPRSLATGTATVGLMGLTASGVGLLSCGWSKDADACAARGRISKFTQSGAALGVLTASLLADRLPASRVATSSAFAGAAWGAWNGYLLTRLDTRFNSEGAAGGAMTLGGVAAAGAYLVADQAGLRAPDAWGGLAGTLLANAWGAGLAYLIPRTSTGTRAGLTVGAPWGLAAVGGVTALFLADRPALNTRNLVSGYGPLSEVPAALAHREISVGRVLLGAGLGAWHMGLMPRYWDTEAPDHGERIVGGAVAGGLTGAGLSLFTAPWLETVDLVEAGVYAGAGNLFGAGVGLYRDGDHALYSDLLGLGALTLGATLAPHTRFEARDAAWIGANMFIGAAYGATLTDLTLHNASDESASNAQRLGSGAAMGAVLGGLATAAAGQWMDPLGPGDVGELLLTVATIGAFGAGVGHFVDIPPNAWLFGVGLIGKGLVANVSALQTSYTANDSLWIMASTALGGWHGALWDGHLGSRSYGEQKALNGGLIGASSAALMVGALAQFVDRQPADIGEMMVAAALGNALALGLGEFGSSEPRSESDARLTGRLSLGLGLGLATTAMTFAPQTEYDASSAAWIGSLGLLTGWTGWLLDGPPGAHHDGPQGRGAVLSGGAGALLLGAVASQNIKRAPGDTTEALLYGAVGNVLGAGLGLTLTPGNTQRHATFMQLGGAGAFLVGTALSPHTKYRAQDTLLLGAGAALGAWHGSLWTGTPGGVAYQPRRATGGAMLGAALGLLGAAVDTQWGSDGPADVGEIVLGAGVGNMLGYGLGDLLHASGKVDEEGTARGRLPMALGLGLAGAAAWASPHTRYNEDAWLWTSSLGMLGAWHGALWDGAPGSSRNPEQTRGGAMLLGATGLLAGATLSQWTQPTYAESGELLLASAMGNAMGLGLDRAFEPGSDSSRARARLMQGFGLLTGIGGAVLAPRTQYRPEDAPLMLLATGLGGVTGASIPELKGDWSQLAGDTQRRRRQGGALFGAASGVLTAMALSQNFEIGQAAALEIGVAYSASSAVGYGLGGLLFASGSRQRTVLQLGAATMGTAASAWLHPSTRYSKSDMVLGALGMSLGLWHAQLGLGTSDDAPNSDATPDSQQGRTRYASSLLGGIGLLGGMAMGQTQDYASSDLVEIATAATLGNLFGYGLGELRGDAQYDAAQLWTQHGAGLGLAGLALWLAPRTQYDPGDASTLSLATAAGGIGGGWMPGSWQQDPTSRQRFGGSMMGATAGMLLGVGASQWLGLKSDTATAIAGRLGASALAAEGASRLFWNDETSTARSRIALVGTVALDLGVEFALLAQGEAKQQTWAFPAGGLIGGAHGYWLHHIMAAGSEQSEDAGHAWTGIQFGAPIGLLGLGYASAYLPTYSHGDWMEILGAASLGQLAGLSIGCVLQEESCDKSGVTSAAAWGAELTGLGTLGLALSLAPHTSYRGSDGFYAVSSAAVLGLYGGILADEVWRPGHDRFGEGLGLGLSLGLLGGAAGAQALELDVADTFEALAHTAMAHAIVGGVMELVAPDSQRQATAVMALSSIGAFGVSSYLAGGSSYSSTDWALMGLATAQGTWSGLQLSRTLVAEDKRGTYTDAIGTAFGGLTGSLIAQQLELDGSTLWFAGGGAAIGNTLGWAFGQMAVTESDQRDTLSAVTMTVGGLGLSVAGGMFGDQLSIGSSNAGMVVLLGAMGGWHGAWLSRSWNDAPVEENQRMQLVGGGVLGAGLGLLTGATFARHLEYSAGDIGESMVGWAAANSFGAGLGMLLSDDDRVRIGLMEGFGMAGTLLMASVAPQTEFSWDDWVLGMLATGHGVWQGIGTARLLDANEDEVVGGIMVTTAVGGVAGALLSQHLDLTLAETMAGFSGTLWGAWLGAWMGVAYESELDLDIAGVSAITGDVGLLLSALAVSRIGEMPPARVGYINLFGVGGSLAGAALGVFVPTSNRVQKGTLYGTAVALVAGTVLTGIYDLGTEVVPADERLSLAPMFDSPDNLPDWVPQIVMLMPTVGPMPPPDPDWRIDESGMHFGLQGMWL